MDLVPGLSLHIELAAYVVSGLSPLEALRSASLGPAQMIRGTDSLGTIAPGKLADLVLLEANPLAEHLVVREWTRQTVLAASTDARGTV